MNRKHDLLRSKGVCLQLTESCVWGGWLEVWYKWFLRCVKLQSVTFRHLRMEDRQRIQFMVLKHALRHCRQPTELSGFWWLSLKSQFQGTRVAVGSGQSHYGFIIDLSVQKQNAAVESRSVEWACVSEYFHTLRDPLLQSNSCLVFLSASKHKLTQSTLPACTVQLMQFAFFCRCEQTFLPTLSNYVQFPMCIL
jgi:hypothetical protein